MKLIDADKLFRDLFMYDQKICPNKDIDNFPIKITVEEVKRAIMDQPTAYDVDAVIEQLKSKAENHGGEDYYVEIGDAIGIVKGDFADDNE